MVAFATKIPQISSPDIYIKPCYPNNIIYGPLLVKLPHCQQKLKLLPEMVFSTYYILFYLIMNRYNYLHQDHFVTKLNHCLLISGRDFCPKNLITLPTYHEKM